MKIFLTKNIWWPFGSHIYHIMQRSHFADLHQCDKFVNSGGYMLVIKV